MKNKYFDFSGKGIKAVLAGALLYAALGYVTNFLPMQTNGIRLTVVVLVFIGNIYGPFNALISGILGNAIIDLVTLSFWPQWTLANGMIGFVAGIPYVLRNSGNEYDEHKINFITMILFGALAGFIGPVIGILNDTIMGQTTAQIVSYEMLSAATNAVWGVLGAAFVYLHMKRKYSKKLELPDYIQISR